MTDFEAMARVDAWRQALKAIVGHLPPADLLIECRWHPAHQSAESVTGVCDPLQNWIGDRMPDWMAAIGIMEAAELLVETAIEADESEFLRQFGGAGR